jgi:hypothetical protein
MLAVEGIYQENKLILKEKVPFTKPVKVIVTFLEEPDSVILKTNSTKLHKVAGCLKYTGKPKTLEEMDAVITK